MGRAPGASPARTSGGTSSAETQSRTENLIREAHLWLAEAGIPMSPSKVQRLVHRFCAQGTGDSVAEFLADATDMRRSISYADPTGERAVARVLPQVRR